MGGHNCGMSENMNGRYLGARPRPVVPNMVGVVLEIKDNQSSCVTPPGSRLRFSASAEARPP